MIFFLIWLLTGFLFGIIAFITGAKDQKYIDFGDLMALTVCIIFGFITAILVLVTLSNEETILFKNPFYKKRK